MTDLTIVMYHVVHGDGERGVLARLKGIDVKTFRAQLAHLRAHYTPVDILDVPALIEAGDLPERAAVLSFDDGYASHYHVVFPLLAEARVPAVFFPVTASLIDRAVLDINKIQCVLASTDRLDRIVASIDDAAGAGRAACRERFWKPSRWDPPEVVYVKRMLQFALPEDVRRPLVDSLFASMVSADELYMTPVHARAMREGGMTIGAHGDRHIRLPTLNRGGQAAEIDGALRVLDAAGAPRARFAYSYANGEHDATSVALLRERGCAVAVTTFPAVARPGVDDPLALPRIDTNDLRHNSNGA